MRPKARPTRKCERRTTSSSPSSRPRARRASSCRTSSWTPREEAEQVAFQLGAGANFTELARTESQDTGSAEVGGELGCYDPAQYVPEFSAAADPLALNQVSAPVQTEFGFHVIRMSDTVPFEALEEEIRASLDPGTSSSPRLDELVADADVEIDPRYGRWRVQDGQGSSCRPGDDPRGRRPTVSQRPRRYPAPARRARA